MRLLATNTGEKDRLAVTSLAAKRQLYSSSPMHPLFHKLAALSLPADDYVIFGSGPLVVRGVIEATNDLDVVCRGAAWEAVCELAPPELVPPWDIELVTLDDGRLTFGRTWAVGEVDVDQLIDTAEIIEGLPFARLEYVVEYKKILGRHKDLEHLAALERYLGSRSAAADGDS